ncbi:polyhydroxyalkanoic acid system family protein [Burkholderiaceae bacterium DAT-1]|nr:polyhydroxyalkanoic acid system family protein [Burkholderiaceae bacterium DAT-1]
MPDILIRHPHSLSQDDAKKRVEHVGAELAKEFSIQHRWQENVLHFERLGVNGTFSVESDQVVLSVTLGFLLKGLKGKIESEATRMLRESFAV